jgi:hypothetical protein
MGSAPLQHIKRCQTGSSERKSSWLPIRWWTPQYGRSVKVDVTVCMTVRLQHVRDLALWHLSPPLMTSELCPDSGLASFAGNQPLGKPSHVLLSRLQTISASKSLHHSRKQELLPKQHSIRLSPIGQKSTVRMFFHPGFFPSNETRLRMTTQLISTSYEFISFLFSVTIGGRFMQW